MAFDCSNSCCRTAAAADDGGNSSDRWQGHFFFTPQKGAGLMAFEVPSIQPDTLLGSGLLMFFLNAWLLLAVDRWGAWRLRRGQPDAADHCNRAGAVLKLSGAVLTL